MTLATPASLGHNNNILHARGNPSFISSRLSSFNPQNVKVAETNTTNPKQYREMKQNAVGRYLHKNFTKDFKDIRLASLELIGGNESGDEKRQDGSLNIGLNQDNIWLL